MVLLGPRGRKRHMETIGTLSFRLVSAAGFLLLTAGCSTKYPAPFDPDTDTGATEPAANGPLPSESAPSAFPGSDTHEEDTHTAATGTATPTGKGETETVLPAEDRETETVLPTEKARTETGSPAEESEPRAFATSFATSSSPDDPMLVCPEDGSSGEDEAPRLAVTVSDPRGRPLTVTFFGREMDPSPWSLIALPDTQYLSASYPDAFTAQTRWIEEQRDSLNIQVVMHEGDMVNDSVDASQWENADASMGVLIDANIPLVLAPGDRDHGDNLPDGDTSRYTATFPASRFEDDPWWGESLNGNTSNYVTLVIGGDLYLFMALDFCPSQDELEWADRVLADHEGYKAILSTHALINEHGDYSDVYSFLPGDCSRFGGDTSYIWKDLIRHHDNLQIVLCGHMHLDDGEQHQTVYNLRGAAVHELLANYQERPGGGEGRLRIMTFNPTKDTIEVQTYSPHTGLYEEDEDSRFTLFYEMNQFRELGTAEGVESGEEAGWQWFAARERGATYEWYVEVSNGVETVTGPVWELTLAP